MIIYLSPSHDWVLEKRKIILYLFFIIFIQFVIFNLLWQKFISIQYICIRMQTNKTKKNYFAGSRSRVLLHSAQRHSLNRQKPDSTQVNELSNLGKASWVNSAESRVEQTFRKSHLPESNGPKIAFMGQMLIGIFPRAKLKFPSILDRAVPTIDKDGYGLARPHATSI